MTDEPTADIIATLTSKGWGWDQDSKLFLPKPSTGLSTQKEVERLKIGKLASLIGGYGSHGV